ncbi:conserved phage C-terminal domain-containing protein [Aerococcus viridans]
MANKRMFAKTIIDSDAFLDMPLSTQALYFHLSMRADDDGFINNPKKISRMIGCGEDDLKLLIAKKFLLNFESGVVVIKHWLIHNTLRKDRHTPTNYQDELKQLIQKENGSYKKVDDIGIPNRIDVTPTDDGNQLATTWQPDGNQLATQYSIDKYSIDKLSKDTLSGSDEPDRVPYEEITDYLNEKAGSQFRSSTKKTQSLIKARFNEGFKIDDFKRVIDIKTNEWLNNKDMSKYLRPETLFGTKFESYLNQEHKPVSNNSANEQWLNQLDSLMEG